MDARLVPYLEFIEIKTYYNLQTKLDDLQLRNFIIEVKSIYNHGFLIIAISHKDYNTAMNPVDMQKGKTQ